MCTFVSFYIVFGRSLMDQWKTLPTTPSGCYSSGSSMRANVHLNVILIIISALKCCKIFVKSKHRLASVLTCENMINAVQSSKARCCGPLHRLCRVPWFSAVVSPTSGHSTHCCTCTGAQRPTQTQTAAARFTPSLRRTVCVRRGGGGGGEECGACSFFTALACG